MENKATNIEDKDVEQDNRLTALEESAGNTIPTVYCSSSDVLDEEVYNRSITLSSALSMTATNSYTHSVYIWSINNTQSEDALYYDKNDNTLTRYITTSTKIVNEYSSAQSGYVMYRDSTSANVLDAFSWLVGVKLNYGWTHLYFGISGKSYRIRIDVTLASGNVIQSVDSFNIYNSSNTSTDTAAGTYEITWYSESSSTPAYPMKQNVTTKPSTSVKVIDL